MPYTHVSPCSPDGTLLWSKDETCKGTVLVGYVESLDLIGHRRQRTSPSTWASSAAVVGSSRRRGPLLDSGAQGLHSDAQRAGRSKRPAGATRARTTGGGALGLRGAPRLQLGTAGQARSDRPRGRSVDL
eukprot:Skav214747  [mRNA]  locus=scaffold983:145547:146461:- [translate_table: standard]